MSSFFSVPGAQKKRKRADGPEQSKKRIAPSKSSKGAPARPAKPGPANAGARKRAERDESISGSSDSDEGGEDDFEGVSHDGSQSDASDSDGEVETAAEKRLRLAEQYLENIKEHVDEAGFDAADIDRDLIAERLQEDVAETKGRVYRQLASELGFDEASQTFFRTNTNAVTSITANAPYVYTTSKDLHLHKWKMQDLPQHQYPQTTRKKPKKPAAPPRRKPELETWIKGEVRKAKDRNYMRHVGRILAVAASPDGKYIVTGGEDRRIIAYDAETLKPIKVLHRHRDAVTGLAFRRGTNQLYSCSKDRTVMCWSLDEMAYMETLFGHKDVVVDIDALAQERCVSVGARDRTARLWKVAEESQLVFRGGAIDKKTRAGVDPASLLHEGSMDRVAMIDDDLFVTGSDNGAICLWSATKKKPVYIETIAHGVDPPLEPYEASAEEHPSSKVVPAPAPRWITALKTIPYSDVILSGSWDGCVRVWQLSEDKKKIDLVGTLGSDEPLDPSAQAAHGLRPIVGIINDIAVFERGERGADGLCVVAAVGNEHRLGRWKKVAGKGVRNGGVVFEVPRLRKPAPEVDDAGGEDEESE